MHRRAGERQVNTGFPAPDDRSGQCEEMRCEEDAVLEVPEEEGKLGVAATTGHAGEEDVRGAEREDGEFVGVRGSGWER